jgi:predicted transcriptional regulator
MPDDVTPTTHITLRVPADVVERFDRLATLLERSRSWVMLRALRHYLEAEGAETFAETEAISELDRGGATVSTEEMVAEMKAIIDDAEQDRLRRR